MAKADEISSTEKLLDHIRRDGPRPENGGEDDASPSSPKARLFSFPGMRLRKPLVVGVHMGEGALRLVKIKREGAGRASIADFATVVYKPPVLPDHGEFPRFLKNALKDFCGPGGRCEIWSVLPSEAASVRYLKLPNISRREIPNAAYWSYKKEAAFEDAASVFDFEVLGDIMDDGVPKTEVLGCLADKAAVARLSRLFERSGYPLDGLTAPAVGVLNFLKNGWIDTRGDNICALYIDKESSRIDIFKAAGSLVLSRDIRTGANSMIDALGRGTLRPGETDEAKPGDVAQTTGAFKTRVQGPGVKVPGFQSEMERYISQMGEDAVFRAILPAVDRLTRQVERTLKHFSMNHNNEAVSQVFVSGEIGSFDRITRYMGDALGLPIRRIDPFSIAGDDISRPMHVADRVAFVTAAGAALCDRVHSPNFLCSQKEKETFKAANRNSRLILMGFVGLMAACFGYYLWQQRVIYKKNRHVEALHAQLKAFTPQVDKPDILKIVNAANAKKQELQAYAEKYTGLAVVSDLAHRVHPDVRLLHMDLVIPLKDPADASADAKPDKKAKKEKKAAPVKESETRQLKVEGIVMGARTTFESDLTEYLIGLKSSLLLSNPRVEKRTYEYFENEEVLRFTAILDVV